IQKAVSIHRELGLDSQKAKRPTDAPWPAGMWDLAIELWGRPDGSLPDLPERWDKMPSSARRTLQEEMQRRQAITHEATA
ncbi:MAG: hypothetical protein M3160_10105, partial [Candidatus Eremiobacteraeota bacterium]|nr:hypothetical protein [Candidatus Eremiobacteraeota bacterium]